MALAFRFGVPELSGGTFINNPQVKSVAFAELGEFRKLAVPQQREKLPPSKPPQRRESYKCQCGECKKIRGEIAALGEHQPTPGIDLLSDIDLEALTTPDRDWIDPEYVAALRTKLASSAMADWWGVRYYPDIQVDDLLKPFGFRRARPYSDYTIYINDQLKLVLKRTYQPNRGRSEPPIRAIPTVVLWEPRASFNSAYPIVAQPLADCSETAREAIWDKLRRYKHASSTSYRDFNRMFGQDDHKGNYGYWKSAIVAIDW